MEHFRAFGRIWKYGNGGNASFSVISAVSTIQSFSAFPLFQPFSSSWTTRIMGRKLQYHDKKMKIPMLSFPKRSMKSLTFFFERKVCHSAIDVGNFQNKSEIVRPNFGLSCNQAENSKQVPSGRL